MNFTTPQGWIGSRGLSLTLRVNREMAAPLWGAGPGPPFPCVEESLPEMVLVSSHSSFFESE